MSDVVFISCIVNEQGIHGVQYSIASQLYQLKLLKAYPFKTTLSFNVDPGIEIAETMQYDNIHYGTYPAGKFLRFFYVFKFIGYAAGFIKPGDSLLFYNINERNFLPFIYFKFIRRRPCYVLLADYGAPEKSLWFRLFHHLLKSSNGLLTLSPHISIHPNTLVQELLIDPGETADDLPPENEAGCNKNILFSGSIGYTTGVHIAVEAMQYLPGYTLHISGNMFYDMPEAALLEKIKQLPTGRVQYHGVLNRNAYLDLLNRCGICLSLRDNSSSDHLFNFPSKIGEYLYFNKVVISSMTYPGFEKRLIFTAWEPKELSNVVLSLKTRPANNRDWLLQNFGLINMRKKLALLFNNQEPLHG